MSEAPLYPAGGFAFLWRASCSCARHPTRTAVVRIRQSRPGSGLGLEVNSLKRFKLFPLRSEAVPESTTQEELTRQTPPPPASRAPSLLKTVADQLEPPRGWLHTGSSESGRACPSPRGVPGARLLALRTAGQL